MSGKKGVDSYGWCFDKVGIANIGYFSELEITEGSTKKEKLCFISTDRGREWQIGSGLQVRVFGIPIPIKTVRARTSCREAREGKCRETLLHNETLTPEEPPDKARRVQVVAEEAADEAREEAEEAAEEAAALSAKAEAEKAADEAKKLGIRY